MSFGEKKSINSKDLKKEENVKETGLQTKQKG
jgi:hypothetical protein